MSKEDRIWREGDPRWEWIQGEPVPRYMWSQVPRSFVVGRLNRTTGLEHRVEALIEAVEATCKRHRQKVTQGDLSYYEYPSEQMERLANLVTTHWGGEEQE